MEVTQYFETSVFLKESVLSSEKLLSFKYIFLPTSNMYMTSRYLFESDKLTQETILNDICKDMGADEFLLFSEADINTHKKLMPFILLQTAADDGYEAIKRIQDKKSGSTTNYFEIDENDSKQLELVEGFEKLWNSPLVPYQNSPIEKLSIQKIIEKGSGVGIGAALGFAVASGTPYLFITVPAGMLICASAAGIGKALEKGLYKKISSMLGVDSADA